MRATEQTPQRSDTSTYTDGKDKSKKVKSDSSRNDSSFECTLRDVGWVSHTIIVVDEFGIGNTQEEYCSDNEPKNTVKNASPEATDGASAHFSSLS